MFDERDVAAYKRITAPTELKEKVMMAERKTNFAPYRNMRLAAACFALILGISVMWDWNRASVSIQGGEQNIAIAAQESREVGHTSVSLRISSSHKRKISVSKGSLQYLDSTSGEMKEVGTEMWVDGSEDFFWIIEEGTEKYCEITVTGWGDDKTFLLEFDQATENWNITEM